MMVWNIHKVTAHVSRMIVLCAMQWATNSSVINMKTVNKDLLFNSGISVLACNMLCHDIFKEKVMFLAYVFTIKIALLSINSIFIRHGEDTELSICRDYYVCLMRFSPVAIVTLAHCCLPLCCASEVLHATHLFYPSSVIRSALSKVHDVCKPLKAWRNQCQNFPLR